MSSILLSSYFNLNSNTATEELTEHFDTFIKNQIGGFTQMTQSMSHSNSQQTGSQSANQYQNISSRSAFVRFVMGTAMTAHGTARLMRDPQSRSGQALILLGAMKAAEGATKFCPTKAMGSSVMGSNMGQKMMNGNAAQAVMSGAGALMGNNSQSGQNASSGKTGQAGIKQMVGNLTQKLSKGTSAKGNAANMGMNSQSSNGATTQILLERQDKLHQPVPLHKPLEM